MDAAGSVIAMTRVIGSVRVSTEEQGQGDSLEAQEASIRAYCARSHLELVRIEVDDTSASTLTREGLDRARAAIAQGEASGIVVTKLDRLTRSVRDLEHLKEQGMGAKGGWRLFSVEEQVDTETPTGNMFLQLLTVFAEWERRTTAKRTKDLLAYARAQGQHLGGVPYGWRRVTVARDANGRRVGERGRLERDEKQQDALYLMRSYRAEGMSFAAIAAAMNDSGTLGAKGGRWTPAQVLRVLRASVPQPQAA